MPHAQSRLTPITYLKSKQCAPPSVVEAASGAPILAAIVFMLEQSPVYDARATQLLDRIDD
jgi:hypothetical protein